MLRCQQIESAQNPRLKSLHRLLTDSRYRREQGLSVLEGVHLLQALHQTGQKPQAVWLGASAQDNVEIVSLLQTVQQAWSDVLCYQVPDRLLRQISELGESLPCMAIIAAPLQDLTLWQHADTLILDRIQDAGNVGSLLRTAVACGVKQVIALQGSATLWSPKVLRAAMGAHFALTLMQADNVEAVLTRYHAMALQEAWPIWATHLQQSVSLYDCELKQPSIWVIGHEGQGIQAAWLEQAQSVRIPMQPGIESLNAAVAGAICLYEQQRQRLKS